MIGQIDYSKVKFISPSASDFDIDEVVTQIEIEIQAELLLTAQLFTILDPEE